MVAILTFPKRNMVENVTPTAVAAMLGLGNFETSCRNDIRRRVRFSILSESTLSAGFLPLLPNVHRGKPSTSRVR